MRRYSENFDDQSRTAFMYPMEDIEIACPGCSQPMAIWNDAARCDKKTAHCVNCDLHFEVEEVTG